MGSNFFQVNSISLALFPRRSCDIITRAYVFSVFTTTLSRSVPSPFHPSLHSLSGLLVMMAPLTSGTLDCQQGNSSYKDTPQPTIAVVRCSHPRYHTNSALSRFGSLHRPSSRQRSSAGFWWSTGGYTALGFARGTSHRMRGPREG